MAFKMKGSPMKRNFGIGASPAKQIIPAIITKALIDPSPKDFGDAFKQARKKGKQEFTWKGKKYNTKTK